jgi:shikimate kinase
VGRRLAERLGFSFVDADEEIEEAARLSISEIFERFGEEYFRDGERRVIGRLMERSHGVIATGGGAFCDEETRRAILENGIAIWLDGEIDVLLERVARKNNRPLLQQGDPREILTRLREERRPFYSQAHIHVQSRTGPHEQTVDAILKELEQWQ